MKNQSRIGTLLYLKELIMVRIYIDDAISELLVLSSETTPYQALYIDDIFTLVLSQGAS